MTVIACDGRTMSGDGVSVVGWTITDFDTVKVSKLPDGRIVGVTGDAAAKVSFNQWLTGCSNIPDILKPDEFAALVLCPDGTLFWYGADCVAVQCTAPQSVGCGKDFALAAMDADKSAEEAVAIACQRSTHCGGKITTLSIDDGDRP